jgi:hypothetical protein
MLNLLIYETAPFEGAAVALTRLTLHFAVCYAVPAAGCRRLGQFLFRKLDVGWLLALSQFIGSSLGFDWFFFAHTFLQCQAVGPVAFGIDELLPTVAFLGHSHAGLFGHLKITT